MLVVKDTCMAAIEYFTEPGNTRYLFHPNQTNLLAVNEIQSLLKKNLPIQASWKMSGYQRNNRWPLSHLYFANIQSQFKNLASDYKFPVSGSKMPFYFKMSAKNNLLKGGFCLVQLKFKKPDFPFDLSVFKSMIFFIHPKSDSSLSTQRYWWQLLITVVFVESVHQLFRACY